MSALCEIAALERAEQEFKRLTYSTCKPMGDGGLPCRVEPTIRRSYMTISVALGICKIWSVSTRQHHDCPSPRANWQSTNHWGSSSVTYEVSGNQCEDGGDLGKYPVDCNTR